MPEEFFQFINNYCVRCSHCSMKILKRQERTFCFELFEGDEEAFKSFVYPKLRKNGFWPIAVSKEEDMFEDTFCLSGICSVKPEDEMGRRCKYYEECLSDFIDSSMHTRCRFRSPTPNFPDLPPKTFSTFSTLSNKEKKKEKRRQERQVKFARIATSRKGKVVVRKPPAKVVPVVLFGGSDSWKELIKAME